MNIPGDVLEAEIIAIVKRVSRWRIEPTAESDLALDLGFDSLLLFELIAELEDRFDVSIPLNDVETIRTVAPTPKRFECAPRSAKITRCPVSESLRKTVTPP